MKGGRRKDGRERFSSRLGFILISAGCAVGLGNVWRFPYVAGRYGGGAFVLLYLAFLALLGLPVLVMEFAVGRASRRSAATAFAVLEPKGTKWHVFGYVAMAGNYLLMMFYTTIGGWMLCYLYRMASGAFDGKTPGQIEAAFGALTADAGQSVFWMALAVALGFGVCALGLRRGVERVTKTMMSLLFVVLLGLAARAALLPGAGEGLRFFLLPDFSRMARQGLGETVFAALGQAFFTLSVGVGSMTVFGSYIGRERTLTGEALTVAGLDTLVALLAGLVIFPACSAFGVNAGEGPGLVFVTLPNLFGAMPGGRVFGTLFFLFLSFAALSTIIAVFENMISFAADLWGWTRRRAVWVNLIAVPLLSLPAALSHNMLAFVQPLGEGSGLLDLEDFIVSNNLLPLGALVFLAFCLSKRGWGWEAFLREADEGRGPRFPRAKTYLRWVLPLIVAAVLAQGYWKLMMG